jgi:putative nucleotidyltransferase with HDIG domain
MNSTAKQLIAARIRAFPSLPESASRVLQLLANPKSGVDEIEEAVRFDSGLTGNILMLANSARFGSTGSIATARDAIVRLGRKHLGELVMSASVGTLMEDNVPGYEIPPGEMWRHAMAVVTAAEELKKILSIRSTEVFTAALLHDVGKLVMGEFVESSRAAIADTLKTGGSFDEVERQVTGFDHASVGAMILEEWSVPKSIVRAVRWHHRAEELDPADPVTDVVHVADSLATMVGFGMGIEGLRYPMSPKVTERLGLRAEHLESVAIVTLETMEELKRAAEGQNA